MDYNNPSDVWATLVGDLSPREFYEGGLAMQEQMNNRAAKVGGFQPQPLPRKMAIEQMVYDHLDECPSIFQDPDLWEREDFDRAAQALIRAIERRLEQGEE